MNENVILKKPYQREGSFLFFQCVKKNNLEVFHTFISRNRYYLFDKDHHYRTCLHIVAQKGYDEMCKIIL